MMAECQPKPISLNFGSPRKGEGGGGKIHMCTWKALTQCAGLDWPAEIDNLNFCNNIVLIFAAIKI